MEAFFIFLQFYLFTYLFLSVRISDPGIYLKKIVKKNLSAPELLNVVTSGLHNNHKTPSSCQQVVLEMMPTKLPFLFLFLYKCRHEDCDQLYATWE